MALLAAACAIGLAAWVSQGAVATTDAGVGSRVGELPAAWWLGVWTVVAGAALAAASWRGISWRPFFVPLVVLLPWLPFPVPPAALIWTGPLVAWVWVGAAVAVAAAAWRPGPWPLWGAHLVGNPRRAPWLALVVAFVVYCGAARAVSTSILGGDEPHYLVITQSLLEDRDLQVENNYRSGRYHDFFSGDLRPDFLRRGLNEQIYSIHAPGLPVLVLPAFASAGYPGVVVFLALLAAIGASVLWRAGYRLTGSASAAWFGWATVAAGAPTFFHAMLVYPDGAATAFVAVGLVALAALEAEPAGSPGDPAGVAKTSRTGVPWSAWRWGAVGVALGVLPWLHTRLVILAALLAGFLALRLIARREFGRAAAMLAVVGASVAAWLAYFHVIYGEWNPSAPYAGIPQATWTSIPHGLPALFVDQQFGLVPNAPAFGVALVGLFAVLRSRRRLAVELTVLLAAYTLLVAGFHMWWGGHSAPARLLVPVLPILALPAAVCWSQWRTAGRAVAVVALTLSVLITASMVATENGTLIFNDRDGVGQLLEWATPLVDLPRAAPSFLWGAPAAALGGAAAWLAAMVCAMVALWVVARRADRSDGDTRAILALAAPLALCAAVMAGATASWKVAGTNAVTPAASELAFLRAFDPGALPNGVRFRNLEWTTSSSIPARFAIATSGRGPAEADGPLLFLIDVPPGVYGVSPQAAMSAQGVMEVYVGRGREPIARWEFGPGARDRHYQVSLPVSVNALIVTGDARARASAPRLALQPVSVVPRSRRPAMPRAARATRYGNVVAYAFTPEVYLEGPGMWVIGGLGVPLALTADPPAASARLLLRNGPVSNRVTLRGTGTAIDLPLQPGEERVVEVPVDRATGGAAIEVRAERGFRPADFDKATKDIRYLGIWIQPMGSDPISPSAPMGSDPITSPRGPTR
jgi:hypothetical protein